MDLAYKEDWSEAKQRLRAWWEHENFGRCGLQVCAPRAGVPPTPPPNRPATPEAMWYDLDYQSALREWEFQRTFYGGEAVPVWSGGYPGHTGHPVLLGCPIDLDFTTGWTHPHPALAGESIDYKALKIDENSKAFRFLLSLLRRGVRESSGKSIPAVGMCCGVGMTLDALRGTERLLFDCVDRPDEVRAAERHLIDQWCRLYDRCHEITREAAEGSVDWFGLWAPGKGGGVQNDFSYMISPKMYDEIFLPAVLKQLDFLDYSIYHVDGIGSFVHVDTLCRLPRLRAIQILPGEGKPGPLHYLPLLKKVQAAGKNLHIMIGPEEVEAALTELSARGLMIVTWCASEAEARDLLKQAEGWSKDRKAG